MVTATLTDTEISTVIRALFTHMGRMIADNNPQEYLRCRDMVVRLRATIHLTPMTEEGMAIHASQMYW